MPITFPCPACGETINVSRRHAGKRGACPKCRQPIRVPLEEGASGSDLAKLDRVEAKEDEGAPAAEEAALTEPEVCRRLGLGRGELRRYLRHGCPHEPGADGEPRFSAREVAAWLEAHGARVRRRAARLWAGGMAAGVLLIALVSLSLLKAGQLRRVERRVEELRALVDAPAAPRPGRRLGRVGPGP